MTQAITKAGRKPKMPPADAAELIRDLVADGWSKVGVAQRLGVSKNTLARWLEDDPVLQEAFDEGREAERYALHNMLYRQAMEKGNATAAMFLLKSRHGYVEGDQSDQGGRSHITINLPGAMSLAQFKALGSKKDKSNDE